MTFLPEGYEKPKMQSNYLRFKQGQNKFRIISSAVIGYEYWTSDQKPVRLREMPDTNPTDIREDNKLKHFWAFVVIDRNDGRIKICELTPASIMNSIKATVDNEDWGDPKGYDFTVIRTGEGLDTEYVTQPSPHKELTDEEKLLVKKTKVNLEALFSGDNPFETE